MSNIRYRKNTRFKILTLYLEVDREKEIMDISEKLEIALNNVVELDRGEYIDILDIQYPSNSITTGYIPVIVAFAIMKT